MKSGRFDREWDVLAKGWQQWKPPTTTKHWRLPPDAYCRPAFKPLLEKFVSASTEVLRDSNASGGLQRRDIWDNPDAPKKRPNVARVRIQEMWANVSDTGGWHKPHVHGGCT